MRVLLTTLCLLLLGAAFAAPVVNTWQQKIPNRFYADARRDIKVDGDLTEWSFKGNFVEINTDTALQNPPPVLSRADLSATVRLAWDSKFLYLAAVVKDDNLTPLAKAKDMPWSCDSLIMTLTVFGPTKDSSRYQQKRTVETTPTPFFGFSFYTPATGPRKWTEHSSYVTRKTADGYNVEAAISLADIGYNPRSGDRIKMAYILSDVDPGGKFTQLTLGFPQRIVSTSTSDNYMLDLVFRGSEAWTGEMVTAQRKFNNPTSLDFLGSVDVFKDRVRLKSIVLKDNGGKTMAALPVEMALKPGVTTSFSGKFTDDNLTPGVYEIAAVLDDAGKPATSAAQALFEIVASKETAQGTVGKLPDRYLVPDPYRMAFPSNSWGYTQQTITKDDYLKLVKRVYDFEYASIYSKGDKADSAHFGMHYCMAPLALYKATGEEKYLKTVLSLMRGQNEAAKKGTPSIYPIGLNKLVALLLSDANVKDDDRKMLQELMPNTINATWATSRPEEWGAFNRALLWGGMTDIAATIMPNSPNAKQWRTYADLEWNSWWPFRDHDENSSDYNAASMMDYLDWAAFRNPDLLKDPGFAKWVERYMYQVTPCGGMPGYGDASPWNASAMAWLPVYERMATITRDGRFKWAAHRLLEYFNRQMDDLFSYHQVYDSAAQGCAWAYIYADDSVQEVQPEMKSRVLTRHQVLPVDDALRKEMLTYGIKGLFYKLGNDMQPDKLILRAGGDPFAPCGMVELCSNAGHQMSSVPNFNNLMQQRSVLLTDLGYYEKGSEYHNVIFIEDLTGIAPEVPDEVVTVPAFKAGNGCTYAAINVENYKNWPVTNDRRILFTNQGLVLVKDLVDFKQPFVCRVRQQWQTREITPKGGENWVNTCIPTILMSGLGLGRGVQRWNNPNWDLLIYFTPQQGRDYEVFDRSLENIWQAVPLRISQRYRGLPEKGKPLHFTTLLWPHKPVIEVEDYVKRITVLTDTPQVTVFKVAVDDVNTCYLGINDSGTTVTAGDLSTDASVFEFQSAQTQTGASCYLFAQDVTNFAVGGKSFQQSPGKINVDKSFTVAK
ncbi:MAG TPA: sugar-binding protein [Armatimonadota bacterium]|jgi:hypothetical protein